MSARITGEQLRQWANVGGEPPREASCARIVSYRSLKYLANQVDADEREKATLATRLAEAERARDMWQRQVNDAHREALDAKAELARLRPLAAEAEAVDKILSHPARSPIAGNPLVCLCDSGRPDWAIWARDRDRRIHAPTAVALLERLDALVPKPEPEEEWVWEFDNGAVNELAFRSAEAATRWWRDPDNHFASGRPMRRTVDPTTGVVTLTPAKEGA